MELILGFAILNKAGGGFGILSIVTGHPINFWQWLYNVMAIATLPVYILALTHLQTRPLNVRKTSISCLVYVADTFIGLLYTLYFVYFWFSREDNDPTSESEIKAPTAELSAELAAQSASATRELFLTVSSTLALTAVRLYFTLVLVSFTRILLKQTAGQRLVADDEEDALQGEGRVKRLKRYILELEIKSSEFLSDFFS